MLKMLIGFKYKTTRLGKPKWWYIIHAEEDSILKPLEAKWESVQTQTSWHLEVCTKPVEAKPSNYDNGDVSVLSKSTIISCNQGTSNVVSPNKTQHLQTVSQTLF